MLLLAYLTGCGGSTDWTEQRYDVGADASLNQVMADISGLSGRNFSIDPELQAALDANPVDLPVLQGLKVGEVLTLIQDTMPDETRFLYRELGDGQYLLIRTYFEADDLSAAPPIEIVDFDVFAQLGFKALLSDPQFVEECGGSEDVLGLLGSGGPFDIVSEAVSDPGGHSEFIGELPPVIDVSIAGNDITVSGASPWVTVTGTIESDGSFICTGSGTVAGYPDVQADFVGQAVPGAINGNLTFGADGALPGGTSVIYSVSPR